MLMPKLRLVATILAKNEADIIGRVIEHHIEQGVQQIIVTDNNSTDDTRKIAASYPEVVEIIDEAGDDHNQSVWVTRMAQLACKWSPHWIIHLDADEFWYNLRSLSKCTAPVAKCERMYLHPPWEEMNHSYYLNFDHLPIPQECKIAHRPDPEIVIEHGNHNANRDSATSEMFRHHYPIRSLAQWEQKASGHLALMRRNAICDRWQKWYKLREDGTLKETYQKLTSQWRSMVASPNREDFLSLLELWATDEMIEFFRTHDYLPQIGVI